MVRAVIVDCLGRVQTGRLSTVDVIGAGPRSVAGVLEKANVLVYIKPVEEFIRLKGKIRTYDMLLISAMSTDALAVKVAIKYWKKYNKGLVILGGPIVFGYKNLKNIEFDIAIYGEGEKTLEELLNLGLKDAELPEYNELVKVRGIVFKNKRDKVIFTGRRPFLRRNELNKYVPSTRSILGYRYYWACRVYVETVRGCSNFHRPLIVAEEKECRKCMLCFKGSFKDRIHCPLNIPPGCGYCSVPALYGPSRSRDPDRIVSEIKSLIDYGVTRIVLSASDILDYGRDILVEPNPLTNPSNPPPNTEQLRKLFDKIFSIDEISKGEVQVILENTKASLVNESSARLLGEYFKGSPIHIGCETGSETHATLIGRPVGPNKVIEAIKLLRKYGLKPYVYFIHGLPGQSKETIDKTLKTMDILSSFVEKITVYRFTPIPGTAFEKYPRGPSAKSNILSKLIVEKAREMNMRFKENLVGRTMEAIIVGSYVRNKKYNVAYTLPHGPVVLIKNANKYYGFRVLIKVERVISDRMVSGSIIRIIGNVRLKVFRRKRKIF